MWSLWIFYLHALTLPMMIRSDFTYGVRAPRYEDRSVGVVINTMEDRRKANDKIEGAEVPFFNDDIILAKQSKHRWSFNLELHVENYSNYNSQTEGWWYRFEALGPRK